MKTNHNHQSLLDRLDKLPPFVVYALAKKKGKRPITLNALLKMSNLPERTFTRIANRFSWAGVKVEQIDAFCGACRVDPFMAQKHLAFLSKSMSSEQPLPHLPSRRLRKFASQCRKWQERQAISATP